MFDFIYKTPALKMVLTRKGRFFSSRTEVL